MQHTHTDKLFKSFDGKEIFYRVWNELKSSNKKFSEVYLLI